MSICPEKIVFSEYVDGELPSPWKEKLESHISNCLECKSSYMRYKKISEVMKHEGSEEIATFDYSSSFEKLKSKLNNKMLSTSIENYEDEDVVERSFWKRSIKLPIPVIVAAVMVLIFLPTFVFFTSTSPRVVSETFAYPVFQASPHVADGKTGNLQKQVNFNSDISGFLRLYMPAKNQHSNFIIIDLPSDVFNFEQYNDIFQYTPKIEKVETIETKSSTN